MSVQITCPHCQRVLKVQDSTRGKRVRCPLCGQPLRVPDAGPDTFGLGPPPPPRPPLDIPATAPTYSPPEEEPEYVAQRQTVAPIPVRTQQSDGAGVTGLTFGIIAVVCLVLGCCTCGFSFYAAPVFAFIGLAFSLSAHGGLRTSALVLNVMVLAPSLLMCVLTFMGVTSSVLKESRQQQQQTTYQGTIP